MTKLNLKEIRERCEKARPAPWIWSVNGSVRPIVKLDDQGSYTSDGNDIHADEAGDAEFIAHARTDLPALLEWCERMRLLLDLYLIQPPLNAMSFKDFKKEAIKLLSELEP